jgi:hypothetical protein
MEKFNELDLNKQASIIWDHGVFLDIYKSGQDYQVVYSLDKEYGYKFAVLYMDMDHQRIERIELLENLEAFRFGPDLSVEDILDRK